MIDGIKAVSLGNRDAASVTRADQVDLFILGVCALYDNRLVGVLFICILLLEPDKTFHIVI